MNRADQGVGTFARFFISRAKSISRSGVGVASCRSRVGSAFVVRRPGPPAFGSRVGQMKFGIATFVVDDSIDPVSLAQAIEDRGFASLIVAEHSHIPVSRESAYPNGGD